MKIDLGSTKTCETPAPGFEIVSVTPIPVPVVLPIPTHSLGMKYSSLLKLRILVVLAAPVLIVNLLGSLLRIDVAVCAVDVSQSRSGSYSSY